MNFSEIILEVIEKFPVCPLFCCSILQDCYKVTINFNIKSVRPQEDFQRMADKYQKLFEPLDPYRY